MLNLVRVNASDAPERIFRATGFLTQVCRSWGQGDCLTFFNLCIYFYRHQTSKFDNKLRIQIVESKASAFIHFFVVTKGLG